MKRRILGTILGISMFLMAGCQPTPDGPIVVNKNDGTMEEKIAASPLPAQKYEAPETVEDKFENAKGTITITVDAEVTVPDLEEYPVTEVRPKQYTQEFVNNLVGYFRKHDEPMYYVDRETVLKRHFQAQYDNSLKALEEAEKQGDAESVAMWTEQLALLKEAMKTAPEEYEVEPTDLTLKVDDELGGTYLWVDSELENGKYLKVSIHNLEYRNELSMSMLDTESLSLSTDAYFDTNAYTSGDPEKDAAAQKTAEDFIADLGLQDYVCTAVYPGAVRERQGMSEVTTRTVWAFSFSYCYPADPVEWTKFEDNETQDPEYRALLDTEQMYVYVDETGVIGFQASDAAEVTRELNSNVYLAPFEDIYEKVESYIYRNQPVVEGEVERRLLVKEIRLSYMRVMRKDSTQTYMLIPVWDIIGDNAVIWPGSIVRQENVSFVTINALDGSQISRRNLY